MKKIPVNEKEISMLINFFVIYVKVLSLVTKRNSQNVSEWDRGFSRFNLEKIHV